MSELRRLARRGALGVPTLDGLGVGGGGIHILEEHLRVETLSSRGRILATLNEAL